MEGVLLPPRVTGTDDSEKDTTKESVPYTFEQLCAILAGEPFHLRPADIAELTDYQLQTIYFAPRDPKTGQVLLPQPVNKLRLAEVEKPTTAEELAQRKEQIAATLRALGLVREPRNKVQRWRQKPAGESGDE